MQIAIFGEAEKGKVCFPYKIQTLQELFYNLGKPAADSQGIFCSIRILLASQPLLFFRVPQEGFSEEEYMSGLRFLKKNMSPSSLRAIYLPGVGDEQIIQNAAAICREKKSLLLLQEVDLFDYLTK